jgi:hypothetical protein
VFAAAWFSLVEVAKRLGNSDSGWLGLKLLVEKLANQQVIQGAGDAQPVMAVKDGSGQPILDVLPNFGMSELALMIFILPIAVILEFLSSAGASSTQDCSPIANESSALSDILLINLLF